MPHYASNLNNPSLTIDNVAKRYELVDLINDSVGLQGPYPSDQSIGTVNLTNPTQTKVDLDTAITALNAEISAYQTAIGSSTSKEIIYIENALSLKYNELQRRIFHLAYMLQRVTNKIVTINTNGLLKFSFD